MTLLVVKKAPKNQKKPLRVVLSKGVAKRAVVRNLLKRRIKAVMRPVIEEADTGFVIIVRPGAASLSYKEIEEELVGKAKAKQ